jgi:hypothetical protein
VVGKRKEKNPEREENKKKKKKKKKKRADRVKIRTNEKKGNGNNLCRKEGRKNGMKSSLGVNCNFLEIGKKKMIVSKMLFDKNLFVRRKID